LRPARIDATLGFSEISSRSSECAFVYDKLRRAELQRNTWRFAIREAVLRAIDSTTLLLVPALYVSTTTYFVGSIVVDSAARPGSRRSRTISATRPRARRPGSSISAR
jgi:hypothetical protein